MIDPFKPPASGAAEKSPPITVRTSDHVKLHALAMGALLRDPRDAAALLDELARSSVCEDAAVRSDVAGLRSEVVFTDAGEDPSRRRRVRLVTPAGADEASAAVSMLGSLGAGLLGLSPGQTILWNTRRGPTRRLTVLEVHTPQAGNAPG